jgi:hypothetical protein
MKSCAILAIAVPSGAFWAAISQVLLSHIPFLIEAGSAGTPSDWEGVAKIGGYAVTFAIVVVLLWRGILKDYFGVTKIVTDASREAVETMRKQKELVEEAYALSLVEVDTRRAICLDYRTAMRRMEMEIADYRRQLSLPVVDDPHRSETQ